MKRHFRKIAFMIPLSEIAQKVREAYEHAWASKCYLPTIKTSLFSKNFWLGYQSYHCLGGKPWFFLPWESSFFKRLNQNYPNYMEFRLNWTSKCWSCSILSVCLFSNLSIPDIFCHFVHFSEFWAILAGAALLWYKFA